MQVRQHIRLLANRRSVDVWKTELWDRGGSLCKSHQTRHLSHGWKSVHFGDGLILFLSSLVLSCHCLAVVVACGCLVSLLYSLIPPRCLRSPVQEEMSVHIAFASPPTRPCLVLSSLVGGDCFCHWICGLWLWFCLCLCPWLCLIVTVVVFDPGNKQR